MCVCAGRVCAGGGGTHMGKAEVAPGETGMSGVGEGVGVGV